MIRPRSAARALAAFRDARAALLAAALFGAVAALVVGCAVRVPRSVILSIPGPAGRIEGSLLLPDGRGPHPAIVLIQTAHQNSRLDYLHEARFFASRGVAAIVYDKRGTGRSEGDLAAANFSFLARDALAVAKALRGRPEIDSFRVGYWGMGQGGWIAPIAAMADTTAAFLILVSAPAVSPLDQTAFARREALIATKVPPDDADAIVRLRRRIWEYWLAPVGSGSAASESLRVAFEKASKRPWFAAAVVSRDLPEALVVDEAMGSDGHPARWWLADDMPTFWSLGHDPVATLGRVRAPILAVYGGGDRTIPVDDCVANLKRALGREDRRSAVRIFRDADGTMMVRRGRGFFSKIEPAPGYRDSVAAWTKRTARVGKGPLRPPFAP